MSSLLIKSAYEMLKGLTPLKSDCGKLCQSACCQSDGAMLLFPYEHELLIGEDYLFSKEMLQGYGKVWSMTCTGVCNRNFRPLACRIFPLAPKIISGGMFVQLDARGRAVCPLSHKSILSLDGEFSDSVKNTMIMLYQDDKMARYMSAIDCLINQYKTSIL